MGERRTVGLGREAGAVEGDQRVAAECQVGARQSHLDRGRYGLVADQRIRDPVRDRVHRPAGNDAEMLQSGPPEVLDGSERPRAQHAEAHDAGRARAMRSNSVRVTGTNTTASPGSSRLAGSRTGSKSASGVRPITFQPPGVAKG